MPRKAKQAKKTVRARKTIVSKASEHSTKWFRWGESYSSFMMGIIVVVIAILFFASLAKLRHTQQVTSTSIVDKTAVEKALDEAKSEKSTMFPAQKEYVVAEGDSLWSIAEKVYKSGYNWTDIAKANNLENPDVLYTGTKLVLPQVTPAQQTVPSVTSNSMAPSENSIKTDTYTVVSGDSLWDIAVRAYADGYRWTDIAKANNLENPDLIHSGNVLKLPR